MQNQFRLFLIVFLALAFCLPLTAQEEEGLDSGPSSSWTMISIYRTWTPQARNFPNGGFGFQSFVDVDKSRRWWLGAALRGAGVEHRDVLSIAVGPGFFFAGDSRLGAFTYLQMGLGIASARGISGFDFFSDPTLTFGLSTTGGIGGNVELSRFIRLHLALMASWYTNESGRTPFGLQFGLTFGGR